MLPPIYLVGVWLSIALAIGVTSLYSFQVTEEARKLSQSLANSQRNLLQSSQSTVRVAAVPLRGNGASNCWHQPISISAPCDEHCHT